MEERETTKQKMETKKQKRARSGFWTWVIASVAFRLALVYLLRNLRLSTSPEVATLSPAFAAFLVEAVGDVSLRRFHVSQFSFAVARSRTSRCQKDPFIFPPYHKAAREPFDYYMFGQNYIHPLVDFRNSYVGNIPVFDEIREKLQEVNSSFVTLLL
ncbi:uncharacterized protein LOC120290586 [Eucalyptus grandis]|uniref:uncharacterized protein LOC120290586 n=1 Tax=Eucalyptus grandis TaxID=71139 RepID=UPI00192EA7BB|nr:uncharacterized protein LOC120290586 [Eucalyptus grandis]